jgi:hypothetical protein
MHPRVSPALHALHISAVKYMIDFTFCSHVPISLGLYFCAELYVPF